nr:PREDICTED: uncharacterized protein LOC105676210 [Linepithema humile]
MPYLNNVYRIYVVVDEPVEVIQCKDQSSVCQEYDSHRTVDCNYDLSFLLRNPDASTYELSDVEVLQRALLESKLSDDPRITFDHFFAKTPTPYTCEWKEVDRQLKILMKGFPRAKMTAIHETFPEQQTMHSYSTDKSLKKI